jgi:asparagine synthase (glutamine-hydrolysing)
LAELTLSLIDRMVKNSGGRQIAVPLSAGLDSRLIISALAEVGARNVMCFAYGYPGNYEAEASRKIAAHLGYPWHFAPFTIASQKRFLSSPLHAAYQDFADSNCSTTVVHDLPAISALLDQGQMAKDAIVVNGNSGDYISGLHIQPPIRDGLADMSHDQRKDIIVSTMTRKHYRLWTALATPERDSIVEHLLRQEIDRLPLSEIGSTEAHGVYEYLEFQDRQSKYVVSRQRLYEFMGVDWRLPLWSRDYLDFWQTVPLHFKRGQTLYANMLRRKNWGGVWQGDQWQFPRYVTPRWMAYGVRPFARAACLPFGAKAWQKFERRFLSYWTDLFALQAIEPYHRVALDKRGARHLVAWHTEAYLARKGIAWDGSVDEP